MRGRGKGGGFFFFSFYPFPLFLLKVLSFVHSSYFILFNELEPSLVLYV